jgi:hypothetical protein
MPRAMEDCVTGGVGKKWAERLEKFQVRFTCRINLKKIMPFIYSILSKCNALLNKFSKT